jgi:hypothetical protein
MEYIYVVLSLDLRNIWRAFVHREQADLFASNLGEHTRVAKVRLDRTVHIPTSHEIVGGYSPPMYTEFPQVYIVTDTYSGGRTELRKAFIDHEQAKLSIRMHANLFLTEGPEDVYSIPGRIFRIMEVTLDTSPYLPQENPPMYPGLPQRSPPMYPGLPQQSPPVYPGLPQRSPPMYTELSQQSSPLQGPLVYPSLSRSYNIATVPGQPTYPILPTPVGIPGLRTTDLAGDELYEQLRQENLLFRRR